MKPILVDMTDMPWAFDNPLAYVFGSLFGYNQYKATEASTKKQIDYNEYLKKGNIRAQQDWNKNVGSKGVAGSHPTIKYPELSYAGRIAQANTGSARAMYDAYTASANYYGNLPYRAGGLFGISSRISRWI